MPSRPTIAKSSRWSFNWSACADKIVFGQFSWVEQTENMQFQNKLNEFWIIQNRIWICTGRCTAGWCGSLGLINLNNCFCCLDCVPNPSVSLISFFKSLIRQFWFQDWFMRGHNDDESASVVQIYLNYIWNLSAVISWQKGLRVASWSIPVLLHWSLIYPPLPLSIIQCDGCITASFSWVGHLLLCVACLSRQSSHPWQWRRLWTDVLQRLKMVVLLINCATESILVLVPAGLATSFTW